MPAILIRAPQLCSVCFTTLTPNMEISLATFGIRTNEMSTLPALRQHEIDVQDTSLRRFAGPLELERLERSEIREYRLDLVPNQVLDR